MWYKKKIIEAKLVSCIGSLNEMYLTSFGIVYDVLVFGSAAAKMETVCLHAVPINI